MIPAVVVVYVELLEEGTQVWRPVAATVDGNDTYTLLCTEGYDSSDEQWKYAPNTIVRCERRGDSLYAVAEVDEVESQ